MKRDSSILPSPHTLIHRTKLKNDGKDVLIFKDIFFIIIQILNLKNVLPGFLHQLPDIPPLKYSIPGKETIFQRIGIPRRTCGYTAMHPTPAVFHCRLSAWLSCPPAVCPAPGNINKRIHRMGLIFTFHSCPPGRCCPQRPCRLH